MFTIHESNTSGEEEKGIPATSGEDEKGNPATSGQEEKGNPATSGQEEKGISREVNGNPIHPGRRCCGTRAMSK